MSKPNGLDQSPKQKNELPRPSFYDLCKMHGLDYDTMLLIAEQADVSKKVVEDIYIGNLVNRSHAVPVLAAFSKAVGTTWTLENVNIEVRMLETSPRPSFLDLMAIFGVPTKMLAIFAGVPDEVIDEMLCSVPVKRDDALRVLEKLSALIYQDCNLETVSIPLIAEEGNEDANAE